MKALSHERRGEEQQQRCAEKEPDQDLLDDLNLLTSLIFGIFLDQIDGRQIERQKDGHDLGRDSHDRGKVAEFSWTQDACQRRIEQVVESGGAQRKDGVETR